jgi:hypothetical protein
MATTEESPRRLSEEERTTILLRLARILARQAAREDHENERQGRRTGEPPSA